MHVSAALVLVIGLLLVLRISFSSRDEIREEHPAGSSADGALQEISQAVATSDGKPSFGKQVRQGLFEEVPAAASGVEFHHRLVPDHPLAYLYDSGYACGGVALGDVDGNGLCDIFLVSGPDENALFLNQGDFIFEKSAASQTLAGGDSWGISASMPDVDGDGDLDIFVCNYNAPNRLWLNEGLDPGGNLRFVQCGMTAGLNYAGPSQYPYFADFDGDGDLDLFLLTNRLYSPFGRPQEAAYELGPDNQPRIKQQYAKYFRIVRPDLEVPGDGRPAPPPFMLEYGHADRLYRNDGPGADGRPQFQDVTAASGLAEANGHGLSALIWDVNHDGRADIYVANDFTDPDYLWLNSGPADDGSFRFQNGIAEYVPYTTWSSMGSDIADVNNDGRLDFLVADMAGTTHFKAKTTMGEMTGWRRWVLEHGWPRQAMRNMLFVDSAAGRYQEIAFFAGVARSDWTWAVKFADFDLDGWNDLFLTNGSARVFNDSDIAVRPEMLIGRTEWDIFRDAPELYERDLAFRNTGGLKFSDVSRSWNLDKESMSYGAAVGDLDQDGDLDLVVCKLNDNVALVRNRATESGAHWLRVRLQGDGANRMALGAEVTVTLNNGMSLVRLMNPQTGYLSFNEPLLHFGIGRETAVKDVVVRWPSGKIQSLGRQPADQLLVVSESASRTPEIHQPSAAPMFVEVSDDIGLRFQHTEHPFDDYQREFLLPGKLSQFGPGVAVADVNGDGLDDVFVGGAAGQTSALFVHQPDHNFKPLANGPWTEHAGSETMGALFFDADRDGDLDLYTASGSNEWTADDARYADRLYINQSEPGGEVSFVEAPAGAAGGLRDSGSCVVGADFDRDGDVDLFVGARSIPGQYPSTPNSTLLRNESFGPAHIKFENVTDAIAPGLRQAGLVTSALWSDVDGDGWIDLLVAYEWGPVRLYINRGGQLVDATEEAGLGDRLGWWNSITGADFDGDGDIDYAALNVGLNTKYGQASTKKPSILYRGDMDENGVFDLVEAKVSSEGELPVRGRSCSCMAMPLLRSKFPTYRAFASAVLPEIYTDDQLRSSDKRSATEFASGVWLNHSELGTPKFTWQPLPTESQLSPGFGAVAIDFFGQGTPALAIAQNLYSREPETGLWRGGLGCILQASSQGFSAIGVPHSGFIVSGDGKALAVADLDADGWPDLIATQNNDRLLAFRHTQGTPAPGRALIAIRLKGPVGNPGGYGARLTLVVDNRPCGSAEVYGGSGYLSQSAATAYFLSPAEATTLQVQVTWPTGEQTVVPIPPERRSISVQFPGHSIAL